MPMMTDAANEKIVRRDMITVLPGLPKKRIAPAPLDDFGTSCAREPQPSLIWIKPGTAGLFVFATEATAYAFRARDALRPSLWRAL
jgi:hypothetical protein